MKTLLKNNCMKNIIFYQTKTKFSNTGDALINRGLIETLRKFGEIIANDRIPFEFLKDLGVVESERLKSHSNRGFSITVLCFAIKAIFNGNKIFIFSGLGHNYGGSYKKVIRNIISGFLFPILRLCGVRIVRIGISIGPITKLLGLTEWFRSLFISNYLVRDTKSLELCHSIGIKKAEICPDLSWAYVVDSQDVVKPIVVVNLRNSTLDEYVFDSYITKLVGGLKNILEELSNKLGEKLEVRVVYQVAEDKLFAEFIYNEISSIYNASFVNEQLRLSTAHEYYGKSFVTISNRMHSLLFAYKYNSLPIALIDKKEHVKITATFEDAGIDELIFDVNSNAGFSSQLQEIVLNKKTYLEQLKEIETDNRLLIVNKLNEVFDK